MALPDSGFSQVARARRAHPNGSSTGSARDLSTRNMTRPASNASAIIISNVLLDHFMPLMIAVDLVGGQTTEGAAAVEALMHTRFRMD